MSDLFETDTVWFHQFVALFTQGDAARMGPHTFMVYSCIKAHTSFATGKSFPSIDTIAEKTGISKRQVILSLQRLEEMGYLTKEKQWKHNVYTLREKFQFKDKEGKPVAVATFDYIPQLVREATAELKRFKVEGDGTYNIINIEKLIIENPVVVNVQGDINVSLENIKDTKLREQLRRLIETARSRASSSPDEK